VLALWTAAMQAGGSLAGTSHPKPRIFEPNLERAGDFTLEGTTWTQETEEHTVLLRQVNSDERLGFIKGRTGVPIDPFASPGESPPRYLTYLMVVENRGDAAIGFNALDCWLKTNREEILTPIGLSDLGFDYQLAGLELPASYERIAVALLEGAEAINPGQTLSGLLVYHVPHERTRHFHIDIDLIPLSGEIIRFRAPYRRFQEEKPKHKKKKKKAKETP